MASHQGLQVPPAVQDLIARVPFLADARDLHVQALEDVISLNNSGYRVIAGGAEYLLRVASDTGQYHGIRREEELESAVAAAQAGVGPDILYSEPQGHMVMPFICGRHWTPEEFHDEANLSRLAATLRRLHEVRGVRAEGSVFRRIDRLLESARALQLDMPPRLDRLVEKMRRLEAERLQDTRFRPCLSHNDFWCNNFLDDGQKLWLVDWEFAGNGDGLYDLATISIGSSYSEAEQIALLRACGYTEPDDLQRLQQMKQAASFFEAAWALVQHGLRGSADFDYLSYSQSMFLKIRDLP